LDLGAGVADLGFEPDADQDAETSDDQATVNLSALTDLGWVPDMPNHLSGEAGIVLRIYPLDVWGRPLSDATLEMRVPGGLPTELTGRPSAEVRLDDAGRYEISLSAAEHQSQVVSIDYSGGLGLDSVQVDPAALSGQQAVAVSRSPAGDSQVVALFIGLSHSWFAPSGRPPRAGNSAEIFIDHETYYEHVHERLLGATESIHIATWWWTDDFELMRPMDTHTTMPEEERRENTLLAITEASEADIRVMVWLDNLADLLTVSDGLERHGEATDDGFEFMGQVNPVEGRFWWEITPFSFTDRVLDEWPEVALTDFDDSASVRSFVEPRLVDLTDWPVGIDLSVQFASWHQKFWVLDGDEAYVTGVNLRSNDWDTAEHRVFEPRRMEFGASESDRQAVSDRDLLPDHPPRKDYAVYVTGPIVQDVQDVFQTRWQYLIDTGQTYADNASVFEVGRNLPTTGTVQMQLTTTMPAPFSENSILETQLNAIANAEDYILIEDQYWRAPLLVDAILERMTEVDTLELVVVTQAIDEFFDPGCEWTFLTNAQLQRAVGDRYHLYQLRSFDYVETWGFDDLESRFMDINLHSKLLIVDDRFMSVGSANKNNRGLIYEGEMNLAILDEAVVSATRERILTNILGETSATDRTGWLAQLQTQAASNDAVWDAWDEEGFDISLDGDSLPTEYTPRGFLYTLSFGDSDDCLIEGTGQDMF